MYTTVIERFPEWSEQIRLLMQQDMTFAEICSEYEELANWLANHSHGDSTPESDCIANWLLLKEMELEILEYLQAVKRQSRR